MPGNINMYRKVRVGIEMLATVTHDASDKCLGVFCPMPHDRPISKRVGSSLTRGGHDIDIEMKGDQFDFKLEATYSDGVVDGFMLQYELPPVIEVVGPDGTSEATVARNVVAVAKLSDVASTFRGLFKYFEWSVSVMHTNLCLELSISKIEGP